MTVFSFHLLRAGPATVAKALAFPPRPRDFAGLQHAECMTTMRLGSPVVSPDRMQLRELAVFAAWDDEAALERFLETSSLGRRLREGWHVRLEFLRRWGQVAEFDGLPLAADVRSDSEAPVVAVTLARLKFPQIPRFIRWGKPVEVLVRDHPGTVLALAAAHPLRTVSTFSVWTSQREMAAMVRGHRSPTQAPDVVGVERHAAAMSERERKDFHFEFTTLRFRPMSEHGEWRGRTNIIPTTAPHVAPRDDVD